MLRPSDIANALGLSRQEVCRLCRAGVITGAKKVDGAWVIPDDFQVIEPKRGPISKVVDMPQNDD